MIDEGRGPFILVGSHVSPRAFLGSVMNLEPNAPFWLVLWVHQLSNRIKNGPELRIIAPLQIIEPSRKVFVRHNNFTQSYECPHYFNVYQYGAPTAQDGRQHGDSLFRKCLRQISTAAPT